MPKKRSPIDYVGASKNTKLRIDYEAFGRLLTNWLNDNKQSVAFLAKQCLIEDRGGAESIIDAMVKGLTTRSEKDVRQIAEFCGIQIPYTDTIKQLPRRSPFG